MLPLQIVYADEVLLVLEKPSGLLSVPGRGEDKQDSLSARAQACHADALVVHRLDRDTSGLILMARGRHAQSVLSKAFANRRVHKRYQAVVFGLPPKPVQGGWGVIDLPLALDWPNRPRHIVDPVQGKPSVTRWKPLPEPWCGTTPVTATCTRLELEPVTGRSHQLRVHLQALGHPILGDTLYAPPEAQALAARLLLHACFLAFRHPITGEEMEFNSSVPF